MDGSLYIGRERNENVTGRETDRNSGKLGGSGSGSGSGSEMNGGRLSGVSVRTRDTKSGFPEVDYVNAPDDDPEAMIDVDLDFEDGRCRAAKAYI
nr:hypothetical protein BaRGS_004080 [Batillaria attramentaria]